MECTEVEAVTCQVLKLGFESSFALWKCLLFCTRLVGKVGVITPPFRSAVQLLVYAAARGNLVNIVHRV